MFLCKKAILFVFKELFLDVEFLKSFHVTLVNDTLVILIYFKLLYQLCLYLVSISSVCIVGCTSICGSFHHKIKWFL